jgi:hypothetical protein
MELPHGYWWPDALAAGSAWLNAADPERSRDPDRLTDQLQLAARAEQLSRLALFEAVQVARQEGRSWQAIGDVLGLSKSAAHERFAAALGDEL